MKAPLSSHSRPATATARYSRFVAGGLVLLSGVAYLGLAYATPRTQFGQLLLLFGAAFGLYGWLLQGRLSLRTGLMAALLFRVLWLPALPALSDDYHRFRWDGLLVAAGVNPFEYRPDELTTFLARSHAGQLSASVREQLQVLYPKLNSPHYYSVYPPVCQAVFGLASGLFPTSERGAVGVMRLVLLLAETATAGLLLALLRRFGLPAQRALWYLLNPLVIVELTGNLHFEALVVAFLLLALWLLTKHRLASAAAALGLAIGSKLLPLLVLPLLLRRLRIWPFAGVAALIGAVVALLFLPFVSAELIHNIGRSLDLYFRSFEFNASLYYVARAAGYWLTGYNQIARIGPALALLLLVVLGILLLREKRPTWATLPGTLLLVLTAYYLLATVVHPWYLTPLVALSVFTRYRYALIWSALVVVSYAAYQTSSYTENPWLLALEYTGLLLAAGADTRRTVTTPASSNTQ